MTSEENKQHKLEYDHPVQLSLTLGTGSRHCGSAESNRLALMATHGVKTRPENSRRLWLQLWLCEQIDQPTTKPAVQTELMKAPAQKHISKAGSRTRYPGNYTYSQVQTLDLF